MENLKLSIITVTYNSERYIRETMRSILEQNYQNYEYIVVDGGSTDDTLSILEEYKQLFGEKLYYISGRDNGIYDAMNKGIRLASGDYIGLINSDDRYTNTCFETVAKIVREEEVEPDVIYSDLYLIDSNGDRTGCLMGDANKLRIGMLVNHPTCFVRKTTYEKYGLFDIHYRIAADYDFMLRVYHNGGTFKKSSTVCAEFRVGGTSFDRYESVIEKYKIQRKYYGIIHCQYIKLRGIYRCKIVPILKKYIKSKKGL